MSKWKNLPRGTVCPNCSKSVGRSFGLRENKETGLWKCFKCGGTWHPNGPDHGPFERREPLQKEPYKPTEYIPTDAGRKWCSGVQDSVLFGFLAERFTEEKAAGVCRMYGVGTLEGRPAYSVFLTIDDQKRIRTAKAVAYEPDGHRRKTGHMDIFAPKPYTGESFRAVLFGLHLLKPGAEVHVVESEKTALMCACMLPEGAGRVYLATGGAASYSARIRASKYALKAAGVKSVTYWPDADNAGREAVAGLRVSFKAVGVDVQVRHVLELWPDAPNGTDLADYLEGRLNGTVPAPRPAEPAQTAPETARNTWEQVSLSARIWGPRPEAVQNVPEVAHNGRNSENDTELPEQEQDANTGVTITMTDGLRALIETFDLEPCEPDGGGTEYIYSSEPNRLPEGSTVLYTKNPFAPEMWGRKPEPARLELRPLVQDDGEREPIEWDELPF